MVIPNRSTFSQNTIGNVCDWGMVFSFCALIFILPVSIAFLDSFAGLAIFFYLLKKINRIVIEWPLRASHLNFWGKIRFIWKGLGPIANILNRPLQFLTLAILISVLFSQYPGLSVLAFLGKFLKVIFLYFSFIEVFSDEKRIRLFLLFFFASAFITALSGGVQHYTGRDFIKGHHIGYENLISSQRISSVFVTANGFGAYLLPVIGLVAHFLYSTIARRSWVLGGLLTAFLGLLLTCLCWTYSRSSWIGFLVILIVMFLLDRRKALFAGALLLIFIFIFLPSLNNVRHLYLINDNAKVGSVQNEISKDGVKHTLEDAGSGRFAFWKKAISIIRSSPIYGSGLNTYGKVMRRDPDHKVWSYAHNCYLQMAAETGLLGLGCFLWVLFVLLRYGIHHCDQIKDVMPLTCLQGALAGLSAFLVQSFFDNTFYTVQLGVLLWTMIGLIVAVTRLNFPAEGARPNS